MSKQKRASGKSKSGGMTVRKLFLLFAAAAVVLLAGFGYLAVLGIRHYFDGKATDNATAQHEREEKAAENTAAEATAKAAREARLTLARNRQADVLTEARHATNVLGGLLAGVNQLAVDAFSLKTNEAGRLVALHPDLTAQAKRFYETELGTISKPAEIITKLENARRVEAQVAASLGTAYEPEPALALDAKSAVAWADQEQQKLTGLQNQMAALVSESKIKVTSATITPESATLDRAIQELTARQTISNTTILVETTREAEKGAAATKAKAERDRIMQDALDQSNKTYQATQEMLAQQRREDEIREANKKVADAKAEEKARHVILLQKAAAPEVKTKLAPFVTPGYWSPRGTYVEKKPLSYTILLNEGALDPSPPGLGKLAGIAMAVDDKVRPRWHLAGGRLGWFKVPSSLEQVKEAQKLLIELGPVLVETKDLEP